MSSASAANPVWPDSALPVAKEERKDQPSRRGWPRSSVVQLGERWPAGGCGVS